MAVTPVGNPYVESSDLVANYPGASEALAERIDIVGVNPFANAAARDAAIPSPVQGQMCSLNDDNKGYRYDGAAWSPVGGKILQLLAINSDSTVTNSTLTAATLLTLSITPSSTDSKVLVMGSLSVLNTAGSNGLCDLNIERGVTIWLIGRGGNSASVNNRASLAGNIIDAPASTSSLTYELTFAKTSSGTTSVTTQGYYTLTLMEVAA